MRKLTRVNIIAAAILMIAAAGLIYRFPPVYNRISWRVDFAWTYLRTLVNPVRPVPTALPVPQVVSVDLPTPMPSPSRTPAATPTAVKSPTPTLSPTPLPARVSLPAPAWEKQDINNCGPAALAMYLRFYGWEGDQETITEVVKPYREDRNVNVEELAYYVRTRAGWLQVQYRVGGDLEILKKLIAAGIPVMIEESFYFDEPYWIGDDLWAAHYQLVTGYDDTTGTFIGQDSFRGPDQNVPYETLDKYWQAFNRVYIMIYPSDREQVVASILGSDWSADANRQHALEIAEQETRSDPDNEYTWFNLGTNLAYFERYIEATDAYDKSRELGLPQRMLRYQFGPFIAYFHSGQIDDLLALTTYALEITPNAEEALLWNGWAMYRNGEVTTAVENFQQALVENPNYQDAQYALNFVQSNQ
jgi:tetratricopeptide (TPR) repeat protein